MRRLLLPLALLLASTAAWPGMGSTAEPLDWGRSSNFDLIGHDPLFARGMNSAPALFRHFAYVGNRTDGSAECVPPQGEPDSEVQTCPHEHPGVLVVDVGNPASPRVVHEIGPPLEGNVRETSRELRVWPQRRLLIVSNFRCSNFYHACPPPPPTPTPNFRFYDLSGGNAAQPSLVSTYYPSLGNLRDPRPHEFFLWVDPENPHRALLYTTTFSNDYGKANIIVTDVSRARQGIFREVGRINVLRFYRPDERHFLYVATHSMSVSADGTRGHVAVWGGTYITLGLSDFANGVENPRAHLLTPTDDRPFWPNPNAHSAVKVPGRPLVITTDELYGDYDDVNDAPLNESGCPWGWMRLVRISDEAHPRIVGQYRTKENRRSYCETPAGEDPDNVTYTSYSSHNPTVTPNLAFIAWHSNGLQAVDISEPTDPTRAGVFVPEPLPAVATEDPALSRGTNKVVMWSYPIIKDGLIYVVDIRNGLYVLRYTGPRAEEVRDIGFLEGNSNLGAAIEFESG